MEKNKIANSGDGPQGFNFHVLETHRLRFLNYNAVNILSRLFLALFADFYPPLKH
jgi:hypothetical protein